MNDTNSLSHTKWEHQVSHCICTERSSEGVSCRKAPRNRGDSADLVRVKEVKSINAEVSSDHMYSF